VGDLAAHIDAHGLTCAACGCDVATAGTWDGNLLRCPPCYRTGRVPVSSDQLSLEFVAALEGGS
jgi:hypothetical protein